MHYVNGSYEAFTWPRKPEEAKSKSACIIGTDLAASTATCYLVRDGWMSGDRIHAFEENSMPSGACDGYEHPDPDRAVRGEREMDNCFEVVRGLFRSIPSI